jgi:hypothetical protein
MRRVALVFTLSVLAAAAGPMQVTTTEHVEFAPGGAIYVDGSYGDLYVEGWDRAQVEMTVTKFMPYDFEPAHPERAAQRLANLRVAAERRSPAELAISVVRSSQVRVEIQLQVPRNSRLAIQHRVGFVSISGVSGDIQAACHRGDIVLWLPDGGTYSIDAKSKLGTVSSDFAGQARYRFPVGQKFAGANPSPAQKLLLRVGFGGITIKPILPESETGRPLPAAAK